MVRTEVDREGEMTGGGSLQWSKSMSRLKLKLEVNKAVEKERHKWQETDSKLLHEVRKQLSKWL